MVELLMVIVIIAVLIGLLLPALKPSRDAAKRRQKSLDEQTIITAIKNYKAQYMKWPLPSLGEGVYSNNNALVVDVLDNTTEKIKFITRGAYTWRKGYMSDPYGVAYKIELSSTNAYVNDMPVDD